ncbi:hypothetical protein OO007_07235 [Cocleimonas sp. KMM 6892]|uniref:hypothetical protein n=1 Tax=unclassified Cocleimonas TaxID=2639732 RepID=UPI002DBAF17D|nr:MULTISPECIES: hypothetical protein [unclassified Cocleimonas]MEB8432016.1 hypothetical protein [Cocleimonas sp. KMM 6892]MEC4714898.1 hypothetical protein [Cocleimonas sp. KMM 6895]MEC4744288.1 hypothetical protein [Cocleimonas sp. KMM 6896]
MKIKTKFLSTLVLVPLSFGLPIQADQVISDDLIVQSSLCVGAECIEDEEFHFDTIRLKATNPQIRFQDTSISASFPTNDWLMGVSSDTDNISIFSITDVDAGKAVLRLSAASNGGVALGADAELVEDTVSVGSTGSERRIIHVAPATMPTDAVNKAQFDAFTTTATTAVNAQITAFDIQLTTLQDEITTLTTRLNALVTRVDNL